MDNSLKLPVIKKAHGIMFHHFHDSGKHIVQQGSISSGDLESILDYYSKYFNIINAYDWMEKSLSDKLDDTDICITFDDALKNQYDIAFPVLKKYKIKAFWFIYTSYMFKNGSELMDELEVYRHFRHAYFNSIDDFYKNFFNIAINMQYELGIDVQDKIKNSNYESYLREYSFYTENDRLFRYLRDDILGEKKYKYIMSAMLKIYNYDIERNKKLLWLNSDELKNLSYDGQIIGLHSHSHPTALNRLSKKEQFEEYSKNKSILENIIKFKIESMSHPTNSYNYNTFDVLTKLGIRIGFRANMFDITKKTEDKGEYSYYEFPREDHSNIRRKIKNENNSFYK